MEKIVSDIKLRGSFAEVGNADIGFFPYAGQFGPAQYGSQQGIIFTNVRNENLRWEKSTKTNIGIFRFSKK